MADDRIHLVLYKDPVTGASCIGDQFGRKLAGVVGFSIEDRSIGPLRVRLEIEDAANLCNKPIPLVPIPQIPTPVTAPSMVGRIADTSIEDVPLDGKKNLIKVVARNCSPEEVEKITTNLQEKFGDENVVVVLTRDDIDIQVISLTHRNNLNDETTKRKRNASWSF